MTTRIQGVFPFGDSYRVVDIFGYATRGLPGIEIVGLGKASRSMKEKFIYLSRLQKLKIPPRRYLICAEIGDEVIGKRVDDLRWLELPVLLMFWTLAGQLPIHHLDDCFCSGKVSVSGRVNHLEFDQGVLEKIGEAMRGIGKLKLIAPDEALVPSSLLHLPIDGLFAGKKMICQ